jgi:hypothetical protein
MSPSRRELVLSVVLAHEVWAAIEAMCADDAVLDATLVRLFADHEAAMQTGDNQAKAECHWAIAAVIEEQSRRLDAWIAERATG